MSGSNLKFETCFAFSKITRFFKTLASSSFVSQSNTGTNYDYDLLSDSSDDVVDACENGSVNSESNGERYFNLEQIVCDDFNFNHDLNALGSIDRDILEAIKVDMIMIEAFLQVNGLERILITEGDQFINNFGYNKLLKQIRYVFTLVLEHGQLARAFAVSEDLIDQLDNIYFKRVRNLSLVRKVTASDYLRAIKEAILMQDRIKVEVNEQLLLDDNVFEWGSYYDDDLNEEEAIELLVEDYHDIPFRDVRINQLGKVEERLIVASNSCVCGFLNSAVTSVLMVISGVVKIGSIIIDKFKPDKFDTNIIIGAKNDSQMQDYSMRNSPRSVLNLILNVINFIKGFIRFTSGVILAVNFTAFKAALLSTGVFQGAKYLLFLAPFIPASIVVLLFALAITSVMMILWTPQDFKELGMKFLSTLFF